MKKVITLQECVNECWKSNEFVKEFNRLNGSTLKIGGGFDKIIDDATGKTKDDLLAFIRFIDTTIYKQMIAEILEDIEKFIKEPSEKGLQVLEKHGLIFCELNTKTNEWETVGLHEENFNDYSFIPLFDELKNLTGIGRFKEN